MTPKKYGWRPFVVITGFPSESLATKFQSLFEKQYEELEPLWKVYSNKFGISQIQYRQKQLGLVAHEFLKEIEDAAMNDDATEDYKKMLDGNLNVYWDSQEAHDEFSSGLPLRMQNFPSIDISKLDKENYDPNDETDDRNYFRILAEKKEQRKKDRMISIANELQIPVKQVQRVLHESRVHMKKSLLKSTGKVARKARDFIKINSK
jgi:hypothetical protein